MVVGTTIDSLPDELLRKIFSNLPYNQILENINHVSRRWNNIVSDVRWWNGRIQRDFNTRLSTFERSAASFDPVATCISLEKEQGVWRKFQSSRSRIGVEPEGTVDGIRIFNRNAKRLCLSGSRDRCIRLWDIGMIEESEEKASWMPFAKANAHDGWIWQIQMHNDDSFISCSWDGKVKMWQLTPDGFTELNHARFLCGVTGLHSLDNSVFATCTYDRNVSLLDANNGLAVIDSFKHHRGAIMSLIAHDNYIYTCGEDSSVIIVDRRNTSQMFAKMIKRHDPVQTLDMHENALLCGTLEGVVSVRNPLDLKPVHQFESGARIRQVKDTGGSYLVLGRRDTFKSFSYGVNNRLLNEVTELNGEPSRFDYLDGDLAIGLAYSICFWTNKTASE